MTINNPHCLPQVKHSLPFPFYALRLLETKPTCTSQTPGKKRLAKSTRLYQYCHTVPAAAQRGDLQRLWMDCIYRVYKQNHLVKPM